MFWSPRQVRSSPTWGTFRALPINCRLMCCCSPHYLSLCLSPLWCCTPINYFGHTCPLHSSCNQSNLYICILSSWNVREPNSVDAFSPLPLFGAFLHCAILCCAFCHCAFLWWCACLHCASLWCCAQCAMCTICTMCTCAATRTLHQSCTGLVRNYLHQLLSSKAPVAVKHISKCLGFWYSEKHIRDLKSKNFPVGRLYHAKTFRTKCENTVSANT